MLDEPTAGLDPLSSACSRTRSSRPAVPGKTVLVTSHIMNELEELADDVAFLLEGRATFVGTLDELKRITGQHSLERAIATMMRRGWIGEAA